MTHTWQFIHDHADADILRLALHAKQYPDVDIAFALRQIAGRQKAKQKLPTFYQNPLTQYPEKLPLEQCSSEITARYKASLVSGNTLTDLTGGFGIDTFFLSEKFAHTHYVEQNSALCEIAAANFQLFCKKICTHNTDCVRFLHEMPPCDCIYIDPARRDSSGHKTVSLPDCTPDLTQIYDLLTSKAQTILIKLSPMLDISLAVSQLPATSAIHIVAIENECKEILLLLTKDNMPQPIPITAVNFTKAGTQTFTFTKADESNARVVYAQQIGKFLYEPNAALLKAGAFKRISEYFGLQKLHINSHLYTAESQKNDFSGRVFEVENVLPLNKGTCRNLCHELPQANIAVRNFPMTAVELRKKLKIADGGNVYLFGTTLANEQHVLIKCKKTAR